MVNTLKGYSRKVTKQSEPIPGSAQIANSAGGYAWEVDCWQRLRRFLILGVEGGTYYIAEKDLLKNGVATVEECLKADYKRTVEEIVGISHSGRAPKNDYAIFALAIAASNEQPEARRLALGVLHAVCRTGTHLFQFAEYVSNLRGWGRGLREAVGNWYLNKTADELALQVVKYQQREGWSHADLLRLSHPKTEDEKKNAIFKYVVDGTLDGFTGKMHPDPKQDGGIPQLIAGAEFVKKVGDTLNVNEEGGSHQRKVTGDDRAHWIKAYRLPREVVPTEWLKDKKVWEALLVDMPMTALIRNLATMTRIGLLEPLSDATWTVGTKIQDPQALKKARVHPIAILTAMFTYASGKSLRSDSTWKPVPQIIDALDAAFYASFGNVTPVGKPVMLALDVSGSMASGTVAGVPGLTPRVASAALALITAKVEPQNLICGFTGGFVELNITPRMRMNDVLHVIDHLPPFDRTDCAVPMLKAMERGWNVDLFAIYTDSETWAGNIHPSQALHQYRQKQAMDARLAVVGMVSNGFSIADPRDGGMLDCVGFDTATPEILSAFGRGEI